MAMECNEQVLHAAPAGSCGERCGKSKTHPAWATAVEAGTSDHECHSAINALACVRRWLCPVSTNFTHNNMPIPIISRIVIAGALATQWCIARAELLHIMQPAAAPALRAEQPMSAHAMITVPGYVSTDFSAVERLDMPQDSAHATTSIQLELVGSPAVWQAAQAVEVHSIAHQTRALALCQFLTEEAGRLEQRDGRNFDACLPLALHVRGAITGTLQVRAQVASAAPGPAARAMLASASASPQRALSSTGAAVRVVLHATSELSQQDAAMALLVMASQGVPMAAAPLSLPFAELPYAWMIYAVVLAAAVCLLVILILLVLYKLRCIRLPGYMVQWFNLAPTHVALVDTEETAEEFNDTAKRPSLTAVSPEPDGWRRTQPLVGNKRLWLGKIPRPHRPKRAKRGAPQKPAEQPPK